MHKQKFNSFYSLDAEVGQNACFNKKSKKIATLSGGSGGVSLNNACKIYIIISYEMRSKFIINNEYPSDPWINHFYWRSQLSGGQKV
jgi:hypothetical protein